MRILYGDDAQVVAADEYGQYLKKHPELDVSAIVPWGWDSRLKQCLLKQGAYPAILPTDEWLENLRNLQHRTTILPLQPHAAQAANTEEVQSFLTKHSSIVLKAPWSGSGRGIRWVDNELSFNDKAWIEKTAASQRCVIVEKRLKVNQDFAIEYTIENKKVHSTGLSLFVTQSGVYRHNIQVSDNEIRKLTGITPQMEEKFLEWLQENIAPFYEGPLGLDLIKTVSDKIYVSELNIRHTMGMVAHKEFQRSQQQSNY